MQGQTVNAIAHSTLEELIHLASLAPSGHNTQPWKFAISGNEISLYPDFSRRLPVVDPDDHALYISLGCALENLVVAAKTKGLEAHVSYHFDLGEPDRIAILLQNNYRQEPSTRLYYPPILSPEERLSPEQWLQAIQKRQSTRCPFSSKPIPAKQIRQLALIGWQAGVHLSFLTTPRQIQSMVSWVKEGNRHQFSNPAFVDELLAWIRFRKATAKAHGDGLTGPVMGLPNISIPRWLGSLIMRAAATPEGEAKKGEKLIQSSSALLLFSVEKNDKEHWINLGRSFERVALAATALNIKHAHLNMPCEVVEVREEMKRHLTLEKTEPLLLVRLGYAEPMPYSTRRPLSSIIQ